MEVPETGHTINKLIAYDGQCNFCIACVNFVKRNSLSSGFSFLDFQNADDVFREFIPINGLKKFDSVVYFENGRTFFRSTAVLRIFKQMNYPFRLLYVFILIPAFLRDGVYNLIARHRKRFLACKN